MSGHSKWASIKHKKGAADAKRGKLFTRIIKELTVAARDGGGDADGNPRLRTVIADAKAANMPADNIKRAIRRGTGEEPGVQYDEITYEGYGPGGVALMLDVLTDNKNRAAGEVRHLLTKHGGNLGTPNSVAWMFDKRGYVLVETEVGRTQAVGAELRHLSSQTAKVIAVDTVTGPFDVIVQLEAADLDHLGKCITDEVQQIDGIQRTTTCLAVNL